MITVSHSTLSKLLAAMSARAGNSPCAKRSLRISRTRLGQQAFGGVESDRRKAVLVEPGDFAARATADIGGHPALDEEAPDDLVQIDRRRLLMPILGKRRGVAVVGVEREAGPSDQPSILEKSATARVAARISFSSFRRFSRNAWVVVVDLDLVEERIDRRAQFRHRAHGGGEILLRHRGAGFRLHLIDGLRERLLLIEAVERGIGRAVIGSCRPSSPRCAGCWRRA